jgi:dolichol-phosphate mannosyltransferase
VTGPGRPLLSIVIPAFNEEENVEPLLAELSAALAGLPRAVEVLFIDDGSLDGTLARAAGFRGREPAFPMRILRIRRRRGKSVALMAGFEASRGETIVFMDADLQNDPGDIPNLLAALETADLVSGVRRDRKDNWIKRSSSRVANIVRRTILGDGARDSGSGLQAVRRDLASRLPRFDGMHRFFPALAAREGGRVAQIFVNHRPRRAGRAKYGFWNRLLGPGVDLAGVYWLLRRRIIRSDTEEL